MKTKLILRFHFFIWLALVLLLPSGPAILLSVAVHETGHLLYLLYRGAAVSEIEAGFFGIGIKSPQKSHSLKSDSLLGGALLYLSGPIAGLVLSAAAMLLGQPELSAISLIITVVNLAPMRPFDGWQAIRAVLEKKLDYNTCERVSFTISVAFTFLLSSASGLVFLLTGSSFAVFLCLYVAVAAIYSNR